MNFEKRQEIKEKLRKLQKNIENFFLVKLYLQYPKGWIQNGWKYVKKFFKVIFEILLDGIMIYLAQAWFMSGPWFLRIVSFGMALFVAVQIYTRYIINKDDLRRKHK